MFRNSKSANEIYDALRSMLFCTYLLFYTLNESLIKHNTNNRFEEYSKTVYDLIILIQKQVTIEICKK